MDVFYFLEKIQQKPEKSRKKILAFSLFVIMSIIVSLWFFSFTNRVKETNVAGAAAPFDFIKEDIQNFYGYFKGTK